MRNEAHRVREWVKEGDEMRGGGRRRWQTTSWLAVGIDRKLEAGLGRRRGVEHRKESER